MPFTGRVQIACETRNTVFREGPCRAAMPCLCDYGSKRRYGAGCWPHANGATCRQRATANGIGRGGGGDSRQQSTADRQVSR